MTVAQQVRSADEWRSQDGRALILAVGRGGCRRPALEEFLI